MLSRCLLVFIAAAAAMTSLPARAQTPTPTASVAPAVLQPLRIVAADPNLEIRQAPLNRGGSMV